MIYLGYFRSFSQVGKHCAYLNNIFSNFLNLVAKIRYSFVKIEFKNGKAIWKSIFKEFSFEIEKTDDIFAQN